MVYSKNILLLARELADNEILRLGFTSGKSINNITTADKMYICNDDIIIERSNEFGRCKTIIDPKTIENVSIITNFI